MALSPRASHRQGPPAEELPSTAATLPDCYLDYDSIALRITKMSGDERMYIPDFSAHIQAHPNITNFAQFLDVHEQELGGPAPRLELMLLDLSEDESEVDPVLDPLRDVGELMKECARSVRKNSEVTVEQIIGCIPVGVHIEIRMAVVVRNDLFTLKVNSDGRLVYDTGDCRQLPNLDVLSVSARQQMFCSRVFRCDSWRKLLIHFAAAVVISGRPTETDDLVDGRQSLMDQAISCYWRARVKMLPHSIADMLYEFQGRNESLALLRLGDGRRGRAPSNLLEAMLDFLTDFDFFTQHHQHHLTSVERLSSLRERIVNPVLTALGDVLDEFKAEVLNKNLLLVVDWQARKLRTDLFPGESWKDFVTRVGARAVG